jgi:hypothetical protein
MHRGFTELYLRNDVLDVRNVVVDGAATNLRFHNIEQDAERKCCLNIRKPASSAIFTIRVYEESLSSTPPILCTHLQYVYSIWL